MSKILCIFNSKTLDNKDKLDRIELEFQTDCFNRYGQRKFLTSEDKTLMFAAFDMLEFIDVSEGVYLVNDFYDKVINLTEE